MNQPSPSGDASGAPYVVVAGYGLPGRTIVEMLVKGKIECAVIELNANACSRASAGGTRMISGSASDVETLRKAEIERATLVALMVPVDEVVLAAISHIRQMNQKAHIIARCAFTSTGLEAIRRGANQTIVAEQVIAQGLANITLAQFPQLREDANHK